MRHSITGYTFEHSGEIAADAKSKKVAFDDARKMAKTILKDLNVSKENSAMIRVLNSNQQQVLGIRVYWGKKDEVVAEESTR